LHCGLCDLTKYFIFPEATKNSDPSWFGFLLTVKENIGFTRNEIVQYLETHKIQTRMLFAGNLLRHPCFDQMRLTNTGYRVIGDLKNTDRIMNDTFWIGVYPGMTADQVEYMVKVIKDFIKTCEI
jgi:CDP-6-deoxy-D-xylo-4-hexulose-3-dehydrase